MNHVPGLYAVRVTGRPPPEIIARIKRSGVPYIPRDDVAGDHTKAQEEEDENDEDDDDRDAAGRKDMDEFEDDGMVVDDDDDDEDDRVQRRVGGRDDDRDRGLRTPEIEEDYEED